jgi:hypothetical protein
MVLKLKILINHYLLDSRINKHSSFNHLQIAANVFFTGTDYLISKEIKIGVKIFYAER